MSIRAEGDTSLDNQLSYLVVPLATDVADPAERCCADRRAHGCGKEMHEVLRAHPVGSIGDTAPPFVIGGLCCRLAYQAHLLSYVPGMMNTIVSNVPGPPMTALHGRRARLAGIFSASVLLDQMGLNITLFTFGDRVDFGIHVDPDLCPTHGHCRRDPDALAELMASCRARARRRR